MEENLRPDVPALPETPPEPPALPPAPFAPQPLSPAQAAQAARAVRRLSRKGSVRPLLETFLAHPDQPLPKQDMSILYASLQSVSGPRWRTNNIVAWALGRIPQDSEQQRTAVATLGKVVQLTTFPDFVMQSLLWWGATTLLTLLTALYYLIGSLSFSVILGVGIASALGTLPFVWLTRSIWADLRLNRLRATAVESLGLISLPETASPLARAVRDISYGRQGSFDKKVRQGARKALPKALASLTAEHYMQLDPELVPALCIILQHGDETLALPALEALDKMGDGRALLTAQRLVTRGKTQAIREAAGRILPTLQRRHEEENAHHTLLRASSVPDDSPNVLLRPAQYTMIDSSQTLLRPADSSDMGGVVFDIRLASPDLSPMEESSPSEFDNAQSAQGGMEIIDTASIAWNSVADANAGGGFDSGGVSSGGFDSGGGDSGGGGGGD